MAQELKVYKIAGIEFDSQFYHKSEADAVIAELKSDYKEACDRLHTANLIKDEQLAATRHQKYKRCVAMAKWCIQMMVINSKYGTDKKWHLFKKWRDRWLELAEKDAEIDETRDLLALRPAQKVMQTTVDGHHRWLCKKCENINKETQVVNNDNNRN